MDLVNIREYRKNTLKITQIEAAKRLKCSPATLSKYEVHPETMSFEEYSRIGRVYGFICPNFFS